MSPSTVIRSPATIPARNAADPGSTPTTSAPTGWTVRSVSPSVSCARRRGHRRRRDLDVAPGVSSPDGQRDRLPGAHSGDTRPPVLEARQYAVAEAVDHVGHMDPRSRRSLRVDPRHDHTATGPRRRRDFGVIACTLIPTYPGTLGGSRIRRSATSMTVSAGTIATPSSRATARPANAPSTLNRNVPGTSPGLAVSVQSDPQVGLSIGYSDPTNTGRRDVPSRWTSAASRKRGDWGCLGDHVVSSGTAPPGTRTRVSPVAGSARDFPAVFDRAVERLDLRVEQRDCHALEESEGGHSVR